MDLVRREVENATWDLAYLKVASEEGRTFLSEVQYDHAVHQFEALACEKDPSHPKCAVDVQSHGDFLEMRDKGGVLRKINLRVYFILVDKPSKTIVVLGAYKKEDEGQTPRQVVIKMRNRAKVAKSLLK
jgi:hypothetical protein